MTPNTAEIKLNVHVHACIIECMYSKDDYIPVMIPLVIRDI